MRLNLIVHLKLDTHVRTRRQTTSTSTKLHIVVTFCGIPSDPQQSLRPLEAKKDPDEYSRFTQWRGQITLLRLTL